MRYVLLLESAYDNGKLCSFSHRAFRLWANSLSYARKHRTDGQLSEAQAAVLLRLYQLTSRDAQELVTKGGWERVGTGYRIHDFLEVNPSEEELGSVSGARADAGRVGGLRSAEARRRQANAEALASKQTPLASQANTQAKPSKKEREKEKETKTETALSPSELGRGDDAPTAVATVGESVRIFAVPKPGQDAEALASRAAIADSLVAAFHGDAPPNAAERERLQQAAGLFYESHVAPAELESLFETARERWSEDAEINPLSVARRVGDLRRPKPGQRRNGKQPRAESPMEQSRRIAMSIVTGQSSDAPPRRALER